MLSNVFSFINIAPPIYIGQFHENREHSNIYFYLIFLLILDFYHSIDTRCMEKHNLSIFAYHFGIIHSSFLQHIPLIPSPDSHFMSPPIDPNF